MGGFHNLRGGVSASLSLLGAAGGRTLTFLELAQIEKFCLQNTHKLLEVTAALTRVSFSLRHKTLGT